jgi:glyoxylase-like metal-dependent hydrolase (beta-lactamase superfamily II)/ferredoxin
MASIDEKRKENVSGNFFVDSTCINCDTCRWVSPKVFKEVDGQSAVFSQPTTEEEKVDSLRALLACPTSSIGMATRLPEMKEVLHSFPIPVEDNVYHCGFHSEASFGATSYFIQREEGNVLIDSPRFVEPLAKRLEEMGGVKYMYLTHKDDIADHQKFRDRFGCERILHKLEVNESTQGVEIKIGGSAPYELADDLLIIPTPGHTEGHTVLLYKDKFLFSGDHLAYSDTHQRFVAFKEACWYSWKKVGVSMEKLEGYDFEWVLPGHGRRFHASKSEMKEELIRCTQWIKAHE